MDDSVTAAAAADVVAGDAGGPFEVADAGTSAQARGRAFSPHRTSETTTDTDIRNWH